MKYNVISLAYKSCHFKFLSERPLHKSLHNTNSNRILKSSVPNSDHIIGCQLSFGALWLDKVFYRKGEFDMLYNKAMRHNWREFSFTRETPTHKQWFLGQLGILQARP